MCGDAQVVGLLKIHQAHGEVARARHARQVLHHAARHDAGFHDHGLQPPGGSAQHGVAQPVGDLAVGRQVRAVVPARALRHHHVAAALLLHLRAHLLQEDAAAEIHLRQHEQVDVAGQARACRKPTRVAAHGLQHEHLGARVGVVIHARGVRYLARHLRGAGEAGAVVHKPQVVVDGLRDADEALVQVALGSPGGHGGYRGHGTVAADVEHGGDVVLVHDVDEALEIGLVGELVAARAQRARRRLLEYLDLMAA